MSRRAFAVRVVYGCYCAGVGLLVFSPSPDMAASSVRQAHSLAGALGAPDWLTPSVVEFGANIALFVPMSLLGSRLRPTWGWRRWILVGVLASTAIEVIQLVALPSRSARVDDVVANTLGAALGIGLARGARALARTRESG